MKTTSNRKFYGDEMVMGEKETRKVKQTNVHTYKNLRQIFPFCSLTDKKEE
jgi:hypothetical protein